MLNNVFTAGSGVITKQKLSKLDGDEKEALTMFGLMFMNSLVSIPLLAVYIFLFSSSSLQDVLAFEGWQVCLLDKKKNKALIIIINNKI